jgi:hypothetical protein
MDDAIMMSLDVKIYGGALLSKDSRPSVHPTIRNAKQKPTDSPGKESTFTFVRPLGCCGEGADKVFYPESGGKEKALRSLRKTDSVKAIWPVTRIGFPRAINPAWREVASNLIPGNLVNM